MLGASNVPHFTTFKSRGQDILGGQHLNKDQQFYIELYLCYVKINREHFSLGPFIIQSLATFKLRGQKIFTGNWFVCKRPPNRCKTIYPPLSKVGSGGITMTNSIYLYYSHFLSTQWHSPRRIDHSRDYRQSCLYNVQNIVVYSRDRTNLCYILELKQKKTSSLWMLRIHFRVLSV